MEESGVDDESLPWCLTEPESAADGSLPWFTVSMGSRDLSRSCSCRPDEPIPEELSVPDELLLWLLPEPNPPPEELLLWPLLELELPEGKLEVLLDDMGVPALLELEDGLDDVVGGLAGVVCVGGAGVADAVGECWA